MRIGLSYSRCIADIIDNKVNFDDVLVIIARTNFDPTNDIHWKAIWEGYHFGNGTSYPEWSKYTDEDEGKFRTLTVDLYKSGKLHQPRQFGRYPVRRHEIWLEAVLPNEELDKNPVAKEAWEQFQVAAALTDVKLDRNVG